MKTKILLAGIFLLLTTIFVKPALAQKEYIPLVELGKLPPDTIAYEEPNENSKQIELDLEKEIFLVFYPYQHGPNWTTSLDFDFRLNFSSWLEVYKIDEGLTRPFFVKNSSDFFLLIPNYKELENIFIFDKFHNYEIKKVSDEYKYYAELRRNANIRSVVGSFTRGKGGFWFNDFNDDNYPEIIFEYRVYSSAGRIPSQQARYTIFTTKGNPQTGYQDKVLFDLFDKTSGDAILDDQSHVFLENVDNDSEKEILVGLNYDEWGLKPTPPYNMKNYQLNILDWNGEEFVYQESTSKARLIYYKKRLLTSTALQVFLGMIVGIVLFSIIISVISKKQKHSNEIKDVEEK